MRRGLPLAMSVLALVYLCSGCAKPKLIPNTKLKDTEVNREVLKAVMTYQRAMESRSAAAVLSVVHPLYQDNAGTPEGSDDRDYEGIKKLLATHFQNTTKIRYRIEFLDITLNGREAEVFVYIDATFVFEPQESLPRWRRMADHHRYRLLKDGGRWMFLSGL